MANLSRQIFVTFQKEGVHRYPAAEFDPRLESVSFLANPHRHMFHFRVDIQVGHNDRDIEFIIFKRWLESLFDDKVMQMDYKSCEMLGEELIEHIVKQYPNRNVSVEVSEDGENGAIVYHIVDAE